MESIGGALSAFWCQGGQPANCSPGCPEWSHSSQMIPPLYCVLHTGFERRLWNLVEIRGVPLLGHQGACPTWPRNFIEIFPPCLQRITTFHWNRNVHQISHLKGDSPKQKNCLYILTLFCTQCAMQKLWCIQDTSNALQCIKTLMVSMNSAEAPSISSIGFSPSSTDP